MAMKIVQAECTSCGDCVPVCPTKSITDKGGIFKISKDTCTECENDADSPKCVDACPAKQKALVMTPLPEQPTEDARELIFRAAPGEPMAPRALGPHGGKGCHT